MPCFLQASNYPPTTVRWTPIAQTMASKWVFPTQPSGRTSYHTIPTEKAFDSELSTFVREVLQNANDQGISKSEPAEVYFRFKVLEGKPLEDFLKVLEWEDKLRRQVELATENEQVRDPGLKQFLNEFDEKELLILVIEDRNTTGLVGDETDESQPYGSLVKDFGGTNKPEDSSGGSHGVGKTVLWAFSGISTVLFNSYPRDSPVGRDPPRIVGRSVLPARGHESDPDKSYTNEGWFGHNDHSAIDRLGRPPSMWANDGSEELARKLQMERDTEVTGTSIGVVGFRIPGEQINPNPETIAPQVKEAAAMSFWPAMVRGELEVYVETPGTGEEKVEYDDAPGTRPFVEAYKALFKTDTDELDSPGSFAKTHVELTVPREDPSVVDDPHDVTETECDLVIRQLTPQDYDGLGESSSLEPNMVARFRGAQMVVDYVSAESASGRDRDFVAVLVCGEARAEPGDDPDEAMQAVEQFLKRSEPTQHDDWRASGNDYLKKFYEGTIVKEIQNLSGERLMAAIEAVVKRDLDPDRRVSALDEFMPPLDRGDEEETEHRPAGTPAFNWPKEPSPTFDGDRWTFNGEVEATDSYDSWTVEGELVELDDDGNEVGQVDIEKVDAEPGSVTTSTPGGEMLIEAGSGIKSISFEVSSATVDDPDFETGLLGRTKAKLRGFSEGSSGSRSGGDE